MTWFEKANNLLGKQDEFMRALHDICLIIPQENPSALILSFKIQTLTVR